MIWGVPVAALLTGLTLIAIGAFRGRSPDWSTVSPGQAHPPVILISLDTLRADHLGCYGYPRPTSPAIDAFASQSVRFANVISESCWTLPSHMTLFTGLYPTTHGVKTPGATLSKHTPTLAELFKKAGYQTFAVTGGGYLAKSYGFSRGFDRYVVTDNHGLAAAVEHAKDFLDRIEPGTPFFLFIHAYDLHAPYTSGAAFDDLFKSPGAEPFQQWEQNEFAFKDEGLDLTPGNIKFLEDRYNAGIRQADERIGDFFEGLKRCGLWDRAILALVSDHGEEFGEHGFVGHRGALYREYVEPPVILRAPGFAPRVVEHGIGLKDVHGTLLALTGVGGPGSHGHSLVPLMQGRSLDPWPLFSEVETHGNFRSVVWENRHLIIKAYDPQPRLFDWAADPQEQRDIAGQRPEWVESLLAVMPNPPESLLHPDSIPADHIAQLRALGYVEAED